MEALLQRLDRFAQGLLGAMDARRQTLVLISDHGNVEQLDQRTHTRNPVPFAAYGAGAADLVAGAAAITDVMPRLLALLGIGRAAGRLRRRHREAAAPRVPPQPASSCARWPSMRSTSSPAGFQRPASTKGSW